MREFVKKIIFWCVILVFVLIPVIGVEAYLRFRHAGDPVLYYTNSSYRYAPRPNQRKNRYGQAMITIDSHGFRSAEDWGDKADKRILFIGDSVTYGGKIVDDTQTFTHIIGEILEQRLGMTFTCGNAGVNGYGTDNMAERVRYLNVDNEDVIVVVFVTIDTMRGLASLRDHPFFSQSPSGPFKAISEAVAVMMFQATSKMRLGGARLFNDDVLDVTKHSLERLFAALREKQDQGKEVVIVFSPSATELHGEESKHTLHVKNILAGSGLEVLDLHEYVSDHYSPDIYYDNVHLDIRGHALYADVIASEIAGMFKRRE